MDEVVAQRQGHLAAARGIHRQGVSGTICSAEIDPATASFIDGAVLNNRPFQQAIAAIHGRPAYRAGRPPAGLYRSAPGAAGLAAARSRSRASSRRCAARMSDIPSSQPVTDELAWVIEFNDRVRRLRAIIDSARPARQRARHQGRHHQLRPARSSPTTLRGWREQVNAQVARDAGFAYQAYVRLKLASVRAFGAELIVKLRGVPAQSPLARVVAEIIDAWAVRKGIVYERADSAALEFETADGGSSSGLGEIPPGLRRQIPRAPPAFPDRGAEPALRAARSGALRRASTRSRSTASSANSTPASTRCAGARAPRITATRCASWWPTFSRPRPRRARSKHLAAYASRVRGAQRRQARPADRAARRPRSISTPRRAISTICWLRSIRTNGIPTRAARCWSTISAFRSGTC